MENKKGFWQIIDVTKNIPIKLIFDDDFDDDMEEKEFFTNFEILCFCKKRTDTELLNYYFKKL